MPGPRSSGRRPTAGRRRRAPGRCRSAGGRWRPGRRRRRRASARRERVRAGHASRRARRARRGSGARPRRRAPPRAARREGVLHPARAAPGRAGSRTTRHRGASDAADAHQLPAARAETSASGGGSRRTITRTSPAAGSPAPARRARRRSGTQQRGPSAAHVRARRARAVTSSGRALRRSAAASVGLVPTRMPRASSASFLACARARRAGDDRAGVTHRLAGRRREARDVGDDRLAHVLGDEVGRLLLLGAADLADHHDELGLRIGLEAAQDVDERRADDRVAADADDRASCRRRPGPARCRSGTSACRSARRGRPGPA